MKRILYIQYSNSAAYPCLEHSSLRLAQQGWSVFFLDSGAIGVESLRFSSSEPISHRRMPFSAGGWKQKLCYFIFCLEALRLSLSRRPDWIYLSDPLVCPIGRLLRRLSGAKLIYHEHDSPDRREAGIFMKFVFHMRACLATRVDAALLPSAERAECFKREFHAGTPVFCVPNFPAREEVGPARSPVVHGEMRLLYHGSLTPSRLPLLLLDALKRTPESLRLIVVGYETIGHPGYLRHFMSQAAEKGLEKRVKCVGTVATRKELLSHVQECDIGLALMPKQSDDINMKFMAGASNKPFDYLTGGLALVVSEVPEWEKMFVEPGYGMACDPDDPESMARVLSELASHPAQARAMGEKGRQRLLSEWNYDRAFQPVMDQLCG